MTNILVTAKSAITSVTDEMCTFSSAQFLSSAFFCPKSHPEHNTLDLSLQAAMSLLIHNLNSFADCCPGMRQNDFTVLGYLINS